MRLPLPQTKNRRVLDALIAGRSINLFEAQQTLHDRCLHSTISTLHNDYGVKVSRVQETVPGYQGIPTRCKRYWIDADEIERIRAILSSSSSENDES